MFTLNMQGNFLSLNSDDSTISRNSGLSWGMLQMSTFIGNTFAYFMFAGDEYISTHTRYILSGSLTTHSPLELSLKDHVNEDTMLKTRGV